MDRKNYDAKVIGVFENIGTFFVDTFYNSLYLKARDKVKAGHSSSITEAYKANVVNYMRGISARNDLYMRTVKELYKYYRESSGFTAVTFSEFENRILEQFIPKEYYNLFTEKQKDKTLHEIIVKSVNEFGEIVLTMNVLRNVIDDHMNTFNVQSLQDKLIDIFILQREDYYSKFVKEISNHNCDNRVSKDIVDKLKEAFVNEKKLRLDAISDRDRAVSILSQVIGKMSTMEAEIKKLRNDLEITAQTHQDLQENHSEVKQYSDKSKLPAIRRGSVTSLPVYDSDSEDNEYDFDSDELHKRQREMRQSRAMRRNSVEFVNPSPSSSKRNSVEFANLSRRNSVEITVPDPVLPSSKRNSVEFANNAIRRNSIVDQTAEAKEDNEHNRIHYDGEINLVKDNQEKNAATNNLPILDDDPWNTN